MFSKNLKYLRVKHNLEQLELAHKLGRKSSSSISEWEKGKYTPKMGVLNELSKIFNVSIDEMMEKDLSEQSGSQPLKLNVHTIPVVASVSAGLPIYEETDIIDTTYITDTIYKEGKDFFGLKVSGNSMDKEFKDGDIVIVEKDAPIEDGQIGVVQVNGYESTLKRVRYNADTIILMPESNDPSHQPQFYDKDDEVYLIGRVVGLNRSY